MGPITLLNEFGKIKLESHSLSIDWWLGSVPRYWTCLIFICISVGDSRVVELVVQQLCNVLKLLNIWHFQLITRHITGNPISATYYRSVYNPQLIFQGDQKKNKLHSTDFQTALHAMALFPNRIFPPYLYWVANYQQSNKSIIAPPKFNVNIFVKRVKLKRHKSADVCLVVSLLI